MSGCRRKLDNKPEKPTNFSSKTPTIHNYIRYPDFEAMVAVENPGAIAPDLPDRQALLETCRAIYPPEKEALGVIALEITPDFSIE